MYVSCTHGSTEFSKNLTKTVRYIICRRDIYNNYKLLLYFTAEEIIKHNNYY